MKRVLFALGVFFFLQNILIAQTVQGTVVDPAPGGNKIAVYAKITSPGLTNVQFLGINVTISIPDQTASGGNPTDAQVIAASKISNLNIAPAINASYAANPYVNGGRAYYSYIMNDNSNGVGSTWPANSSNNPVAEFTFPSNSYFSGVQLNDLSSMDVFSGGPNGQMYWYVSIIGGNGDITDYQNMFYGAAASPPVNNSQSNPSYVGIQPLSVLPVNFLGFNVSKVKNSAVLSWSVESEDANTKNYEIQKSLNGVDFSTIATLPALNNGRSKNVYSYTQDNLSSIRSTGVIYFRIKQVDKDGRPVLTEIKNVRLDSKGIALEVYPNPIKSVANLSFDLLQTGKVSITITDATGKLVKNMQVQGFKGSNVKDINLSNLSSGNYMLKLQTAGEVSTMPLVKAN